MPVDIRAFAAHMRAHRDEHRDLCTCLEQIKSAAWGAWAANCSDEFVASRTHLEALQELVDDAVALSDVLLEGLGRPAEGRV